MNTALNMLVILWQVLSTNQSNVLTSEVNRDYNNCMMWRDDLTTVMVTCRVPNLSTPVDIVHNDTVIVTCFDRNNAFFCTPNNKQATINKSDESVTIVLEQEKLGNNLDGTWYCRQGESIQSTTISITEGIVIDAEVNMQGRPGFFDDGSRYMDVRCSSCRPAHHSFAEFIYNRRTVSSVWQDDFGECFHKNFICTEDVCKCSKIGNSFSTRLHIPDNNITAEIGCEMQFSDDLRNGLFVIYAYSNYNENGFTATDTIVTILKENMAVSTRKYPSNSKVATTDTTITSTTPSTGTEYRVKMVMVVVSISTVILVVLTCVAYTCICAKKNRRDNEFELLPRSCLETTDCKSCSESGTVLQATHTCFDCRQCLCLKCHRSFHNLSEETRQHITVDLNFVPEMFTVSIFNCPEADHKNLLLQYFCPEHKELLCKKCKSYKHCSCGVKMITDISLEDVTSKREDYQKDLEDTERQLISFKNSVERSVKTYKSNTLFVGKQIESSCETHFNVKEATGCMKRIAKSQTIKKIKEIENKFTTEAETFVGYANQFQTHIENINQLLDFVLRYGELHHVMIAAIIFDEKILGISTVLSRYKDEFSNLDISVDQEGSLIVIKNIPLKKSLNEQHTTTVLPGVYENITRRTKASDFEGIYEVLE